MRIFRQRVSTPRPRYYNNDGLYHHLRVVATPVTFAVIARAWLPYAANVAILSLFLIRVTVMQVVIDLLPLAAYLLIVLGLIGSFLPILPGPLLIWLGALLWSWADGFQAVGWPTLVFLGVLMVLAWVSDLILTTFGTRQAGASWKAVAGAIVGGIAGAILLSGLLPVIGTMAGTILGAIVGILVFEYFDKRDWGQAFQVSKGYILGSLAARALEIFLSLLMIAVFVWQAFVK
jgi:uncharacterized protein YqgC (DUF456 family)